jgi:predicted Zn-dependent protease with MMP-like domain
MEREAFEKLVEAAMESLPSKFKKLIHNVAVIVEDYPAAETRRRVGAPAKSHILGLYHGVPFQHRGPFYGNLPPDVIIIYQKPIEDICSTEEEIQEQVQDTVIHEVGHYFGFSDRELREIENRSRSRQRPRPPSKET